MNSIPSLITAQAQQQGVPSSIALAVAQWESGFNQGAIGKAGEIGVFQLMPSTAAGLNVDPSSLQQNIQGGITYLKQMYDRFGDWSSALQAYNAGPGAFSSGSTAGQSYAQHVLALAGPLDSSANTPSSVFSADSSPVSDLFDSLDLGGAAALSGTAWAALGLALAGGVLLVVGR